MPSRLQPELHRLNDSNRLVLPALTDAYVENLNALRACAEACSALAARPDAKAHETEAEQLVQDALQLVQNLKALGRWIYPRKVRVQRVGATLARSLLAGVWKPKVFRGR